MKRHFLLISVLSSLLGLSVVTSCGDDDNDKDDNTGDSDTGEAGGSDTGEQEDAGSGTDSDTQGDDTDTGTDVEFEEMVWDFADGIDDWITDPEELPDGTLTHDSEAGALVITYEYDADETGDTDTDGSEIIEPESIAVQTMLDCSDLTGASKLVVSGSISGIPEEGWAGGMAFVKSGSSWDNWISQWHTFAENGSFTINFVLSSATDGTIEYECVQAVGLQILAYQDGEMVVTVDEVTLQ